MTDGSEKRKCRLAFDLRGQSLCVFEKRSKNPDYCNDKTLRLL